MIPICNEQNIARTSYSPLASGRLARLAWKSDSLRSQTDKTAVSKYDGMQSSDSKIVEGESELANNYQATMTQIVLAWQYVKGVVSPLIGTNKIKYLKDAVHAKDIKLLPEDIKYLEELYVPHQVVGAL